MHSEEEISALTETYTSIVSTIDVEELLPYLFQEKLIPSPDTMERISKIGVTKKDKAIELMAVIMRSDNPGAFQIFIKALLENYYEFLAHKIQNKLTYIRRKKRPLRRTSNSNLETEESSSSNKSNTAIKCRICRRSLKAVESFEAGTYTDLCTCSTDSNVINPSCFAHQLPLLSEDDSLSEDDTDIKKPALSGKNNIFRTDAVNNTLGIVEEAESVNKKTWVENCEIKTNSERESDTTFVKCLETPPAAKFESITLVSSGEDMVDGNLVKKPEGLSLFTSGTDTIDGMVLQSNEQLLSIVAKNTSSPDIDILPHNPEKMLLSFEEKPDTREKQPKGRLKRSACIKKSVKKTEETDKLHMKNSIVNSNNCELIGRKCITIKRTFNQSYGFKFIPGKGRPRYEGDKDYYISEIIEGSVAANYTELKVKDTIESVDGVKIKDMKYDDVVKLFQGHLQVTLVTTPITL